MGIEYELKFRATEQQQTAICRELEAPEVHYDMQTTYYDTPSGMLSQRWFTLRRRLENGVSVCTLKAPVPGGRGEWEVNCEDICQAVEQLCRQGAPAILPFLVAEGLEEVCGAKFHRIAKTLVLPECTVEVALDLGELMGGKKRIGLCEVEVELKEGSREAAKAYALELAARHGLEKEPMSKFRRAHALYKGE